jgi:cell division protein FtsI/penicillin-binding protein 2
MNAGNFEAFTLVHDVRTGALIAFAASQPSKLNVTTAVLPLSLIKLLLAASWWDNRLLDSRFDSYRGQADRRPPAERLVSIHEMLVYGSDNAGRQMALALRRKMGTETILRDLQRYGFGSGTDSPANDSFWSEIDPHLQARLTPVRGYSTLSNETNDVDWADVLSVGEKNIMVTGLHMSRFLQAIGNEGVMLQPWAREERKVEARNLRSATSGFSQPQAKPIRVMKRLTTLRLQAGMRDAVQRGTAKSIARALADTGWQIGGKTGTGPGPAPIGPKSHGWFAGLIFDPQGKARFTVATFVRHGGPGGGNAAKISAALARFLIGANPTR